MMRVRNMDTVLEEAIVRRRRQGVHPCKYTVHHRRLRALYTMAGAIIAHNTMHPGAARITGHTATAGVDKD